jgi:hypothetical protein
MPTNVDAAQKVSAGGGFSTADLRRPASRDRFDTSLEQLTGGQHGMILTAPPFCSGALNGNRGQDALSPG